MSQPRNKIQELRALRGLSRHDVAEHLGVHVRTITRWELHECELPRKHWQPLAALLRVSVPWLLGFEGDENGANGEQRSQEAC